MGCFLACFGGPRDRKRRRSHNRSPPRYQSQASFKALQPNPPPRQQSLKQITPHLPPESLSPEAAVGSLPAPLPNLRETDDEGSFTVTKKKVTFDLNVKTYEDALTYDDESYLTEDDKEDETTEEERKTVPKFEAYPLNHRYQNCSNSDDEESEYGDDEDDEDEDYNVSISDDEDDLVPIGGNLEEPYESFFSLSMDNEQESTHEVTRPAPKNTSSPDRWPSFAARANPRDKIQYVNSVLNPVQNLSQWKQVKAHALPLKDLNKENITSEQASKREDSVDASLSTWLVSSDNSTAQRTPESNSVRSISLVSREERPILGALTLEDIKQSSVTSSPRRSPIRSPDDVPILGTVGNYWKC